MLHRRTRSRQAVSFIPRPLYPYGKNSMHRYNRRPGGSQRSSTCFGEDGNISYWPWIEPQFFDHPAAHSLLQVTTMFYSAIRNVENWLRWQTLQTVVYHLEFTGSEPYGMWHCAIWLVFWRNFVPSPFVMWHCAIWLVFRRNSVPSSSRAVTPTQIPHIQVSAVTVCVSQGRWRKLC